MAIVEFDSRKQLDEYIACQTGNMHLGEGTEGICYCGKDGKAYKVYSEDGYREFYPIDDILTKDDFQLQSFAFPETIFTVNGCMEAYTSSLVPQNLFDHEHLTINGIQNINFDNLINAYKTMQDDVSQLTKSGIVLSDVPGNILFDGVNLVVVDTCSYSRDNELENPRFNQAVIDKALKDTFNKLFEDDASEGLFVNPNQDVVPFFRDIEDTFKQKVYVNKKVDQ